MRLPLSTVAFLVVFASQALATCPAGAVQGLNADQCFVFGKVPSTWLQAEEECSAFNGHLASISSYLTNSFVVTTAVPCLGDYWLGGSKGLYSQDAWSWNDGQRFGFINWATGQPNTTLVPACLSVNSTTGKWTSASCDGKKVYVCRVPAVPAPPPLTEAPCTFPQPPQWTEAPCPPHEFC